MGNGAIAELIAPRCVARNVTQEEARQAAKAGKNIYSASEEAKNKAIELWNRRYLE